MTTEKELPDGKDAITRGELLHLQMEYKGVHVSYTITEPELRHAQSNEWLVSRYVMDGCKKLFGTPAHPVEIKRVEAEESEGGLA